MVVGVLCSLQLVGIAGASGVVLAIDVWGNRMTWCGWGTLLMVNGFQMDWQTSPLWWGSSQRLHASRLRNSLSELSVT